MFFLLFFLFFFLLSFPFSFFQIKKIEQEKKMFFFENLFIYNIFNTKPQGLRDPRLKVLVIEKRNEQKNLCAKKIDLKKILRGFWSKSISIMASPWRRNSRLFFFWNKNLWSTKKSRELKILEETMILEEILESFMVDSNNNPDESYPFKGSVTGIHKKKKS